MNRIAFVSTMDGAPWGGSEELWSQVALRLAQLPVTVGVNVTRWDETPGALQKLRAAGCLVTRRPHPQSSLQKLTRKVAGERSFAWLDRFKPDFVVISQGANFDGVFWMLQCKLRNIPYGVIAQMASDIFWPSPQVSDWGAEAYTNAVAAFFVSQGNLELTQKQYTTELPKAQVVRNPFNVSYTANTPWPAPNKPLKLACVGRLAPSAKGQDILIDVLSLAKWRERPLHVTLFGAGDNRETLDRRIKMEGLQNLSFGGYVKDIEAIWDDHHGLILPSRYEGLPLVVVEAMLCSRMCIVSDVPGNAELIRDNVDGFVAMAPNARCLDEALERAWQQRDNWESMGKLAAQSVRQAVPADPIGDFIERLKPLLPFEIEASQPKVNL